MTYFGTSAKAACGVLQKLWQLVIAYRTLENSERRTLPFRKPATIEHHISPPAATTCRSAATCIPTTSGCSRKRPGRWGSPGPPARQWCVRLAGRTSRHTAPGWSEDCCGRQALRARNEVLNLARFPPFSAFVPESDPVYVGFSYTRGASPARHSVTL